MHCFVYSQLSVLACVCAFRTCSAPVRWSSGPTTEWWSGWGLWTWQSMHQTWGAAACMEGSLWVHVIPQFMGHKQNRSAAQSILKFLSSHRCWSLGSTQTRWPCCWTSPLRKHCWDATWPPTSTAWWEHKLSRRRGSTLRQRGTAHSASQLKSRYNNTNTGKRKYSEAAVLH